MGKLVFDTMRGVDFLMERDDIDHRRIGVAGYSLGGAKAAWMAALDPRKSQIVELKFFGGLTMDEIADTVGVSRATVEREWTFARAWLYSEVSGTKD